MGILGALSCFIIFIIEYFDIGVLAYYMTFEEQENERLKIKEKLSLEKTLSNVEYLLIIINAFIKSL